MNNGAPFRKVRAGHRQALVTGRRATALAVQAFAAATVGLGYRLCVLISEAALLISDLGFAGAIWCQTQWGLASETARRISRRTM